MNKFKVNWEGPYNEAKDDAKAYCGICDCELNEEWNYCPNCGCELIYHDESDPF